MPETALGHARIARGHETASDPLDFQGPDSCSSMLHEGGAVVPNTLKSPEVHSESMAVTLPMAVQTPVIRFLNVERSNQRLASLILTKG